jgi:hypothetical protein
MYSFLHILLKVFSSMNSTITFLLLGVTTTLVNTLGQQLSGIDYLKQILKGGFQIMLVWPNVSKIKIGGGTGKQIFVILIILPYQGRLMRLMQRLPSPPPGFATGFQFLPLLLREGKWAEQLVVSTPFQPDSQTLIVIMFEKKFITLPHAGRRMIHPSLGFLIESLDDLTGLHPLFSQTTLVKGLQTLFNVRVGKKGNHHL